MTKLLQYNRVSVSLTVVALAGLYDDHLQLLCFQCQYLKSSHFDFGKQCKVYR